MIMTLLLSTGSIPSPIMRDPNHRENMTSAICKTEIDLKSYHPIISLSIFLCSHSHNSRVDHCHLSLELLEQSSICSPSFPQWFLLLWGKSTHPWAWFTKPLFVHATASLNSPKYAAFPLIATYLHMLSIFGISFLQLANSYSSLLIWNVTSWHLTPIAILPKF